MSLKSITYTPDAIVEAVNKIVEHFGEQDTKAFYAADGEAIVEYRDSYTGGLGLIRVVLSRGGEDWVACLHATPGHLEPGLPDRFNTNVMFDTTKDWWPKPKP
jgi:hypothetical protein